MYTIYTMYTIFKLNSVIFQNFNSEPKFVIFEGKSQK